MRTQNARWNGLALGLALAFAGLSMAQEGPGPGRLGFGGPLGGFIGGEGKPSFETVAGKPFSATETTEHVETLADGTHVTGKAHEIQIYRDAQGRTRRERIEGKTETTGEESHTFVEITDPVAGFHYVLNPRDHMVYRLAWPPAEMKRGDWAGKHSDGTHVRPEVNSESLGSQTLNGVLADGTRRTLTFAEGAIGNDRPITVTSEVWKAHDLGIVVLAKISDPRRGDTTTRLATLSETEPAAALFQVPADYTVQDGMGPHGGGRVHSR